MGTCPILEIATQNQNVLENLTSLVRFRLIDLFLAMTVYLPVSSEISDFVPCAHAQSNILGVEYAEKTND